MKMLWNRDINTFERQVLLVLQVPTSFLWVPVNVCMLWLLLSKSSQKTKECVIIVLDRAPYENAFMEVQMLRYYSAGKVAWWLSSQVKDSSIAFGFKTSAWVYPSQKVIHSCSALIAVQLWTNYGIVPSPLVLICNRGWWQCPVHRDDKNCVKYMGVGRCPRSSQKYWLLSFVLQKSLWEEKLNEEDGIW